MPSEEDIHSVVDVHIGASYTCVNTNMWEDKATSISNPGFLSKETDTILRKVNFFTVFNRVMKHGTKVQNDFELWKPGSQSVHNA